MLVSMIGLLTDIGENGREEGMVYYICLEHKKGILWELIFQRSTWQFHFWKIASVKMVWHDLVRVMFLYFCRRVNEKISHLSV